MAGMRTRVLRIETDEDEALALREAAAVIRSGGLVAFPTETVYGLGADATNVEAVRRIFEAKGRPQANPLIVHADGAAMARRCVAVWPARVEKLVERFWPGPLTVVLPKSDLIAAEVTAGLATVGVRVPGNRVARGLIHEAGLPIAAPSANRSTGISPTQARHVLKDLEGRIDLVLDAGPTSVGIESTVVDATGEKLRILRPGVVTAEQVEQAIGEDVEEAEPGTQTAVSGAMSSPGQMVVHYAPRTPCRRVNARQVNDVVRPRGWRIGLLVLGHPHLKVAWHAERRVDLETVESAERGLYDSLHELDALDLNMIVVVAPPPGPEWVAIADRVRRASRWYDGPEPSGRSDSGRA
jgi:L-threonylcarbamoyladenylate synthase